jgi:hypothetical protein
MDTRKFNEEILGIKPFIKCAVIQDSTGIHCPNEGKHRIDENLYLCDKCYETHVRRQNVATGVSNCNIPHVSLSVCQHNKDYSKCNKIHMFKCKYCELNPDRQTVS